MCCVVVGVGVGVIVSSLCDSSNVADLSLSFFCISLSLSYNEAISASSDIAVKVSFYGGCLFVVISFSLYDPFE